MASHPLQTGSVVPPAMTSASVAAAARHCEALSQARRLATWVGEGKPVTPKHVLRPRDVPAAAQVLNIPVPARINTTANIRALHRPWKVALAIDFLRIVDGHAVTGPALGQWPDTDDTTVRELWLTGLTAASAADAGSEDEAGAAAFSRLILGALATAPPPSVVELWERARNALISEDSYTADPLFAAYRYKHGEPFTVVPDLLIEFGAATRNGAQLEMTPARPLGIAGDARAQAQADHCGPSGGRTTRPTRRHRRGRRVACRAALVDRPGPAVSGP